MFFCVYCNMIEEWLYDVIMRSKVASSPRTRLEIHVKIVWNFISTFWIAAEFGQTDINNKNAHII